MLGSRMREFRCREDGFMAGTESLWQHAEGPGQCLSALCAAVADGEDWLVVHFACLRLLDALRFQFAVEESLMRIFAYPELAQHLRGHADVMGMVEQLREASLNPNCLIDLAATRSLIEAHRVEHDRDFAEFFGAGAE